MIRQQIRGINPTALPVRLSQKLFESFGVMYRPILKWHFFLKSATWSLHNHHEGFDKETTRAAKWIP